MDNEGDDSRRRFLGKAVGAVSAFGVGLLTYPLLQSLKPSAKTIEPREIIEFPKLRTEQIFAYSTRWGSTIYIIRRSQKIIDLLAEGSESLRDPDSNESEQPAFAQNVFRSMNPEYFVCEAPCTHLGCHVAYSPPGENFDPDYLNHTGEFMCPCHGSYFDPAGRVFKNMPAPTNLIVPDYEFLTETSIRVFRNIRT